MPTTRRGAQTGPPEQMMSSPTRPSPSQRAQSSSPRNPPFLPTPIEVALVGVFPLILLFGSLFSIINPETRNAPYDPVTQSHAQNPADSPNYFARKSNLFNVVFVKRGWFWTTAAFFVFLFSHPSFGRTAELTGKRVRAITRWGLVTGLWFLTTQWFFGPALIDRGFRWTGGRCEAVEQEVEKPFADPSVGEQLTAVACKAAGGRWQGGHDISGHVFLLVLATGFLVQEAGWVVGRALGGEQRSVIKEDGALKGASVEAEDKNNVAGAGEWGMGGKIVLGTVGLSLWMLLMTAIYFHTWFEKLTGLLSALLGLYVVYVVPRFVPALRSIIGLPGI